MLTHSYRNWCGIRQPYITSSIELLTSLGLSAVSMICKKTRLNFLLSHTRISPPAKEVGGKGMKGERSREGEEKKNSTRFTHATSFFLRKIWNETRKGEHKMHSNVALISHEEEEGKGGKKEKNITKINKNFSSAASERRRRSSSSQNKKCWSSFLYPAANELSPT